MCKWIQIDCKAIKIQCEPSLKRNGDINEATLICKQSTQTVSVYLNAFGRNLMNSEMISFEDGVQMAKAKLNYFIQG